MYVDKEYAKLNVKENYIQFSNLKRKKIFKKMNIEYDKLIMKRTLLIETRPSVQASLLFLLVLIYTSLI